MKTLHAPCGEQKRQKQQNKQKKKVPHLYTIWRQIQEQAGKFLLVTFADNGPLLSQLHFHVSEESQGRYTRIKVSNHERNEVKSLVVGGLKLAEETL